MKPTPACCALALSFSGALHAQPAAVVDHHQHLFSPAITALAPDVTPVTADDVVSLLDRAGIQRAAVFSLAYQFGNPNRPPVDDEYAKVKAENDWTSNEVARFPDRLRGFCAVNPLKEYATREVRRCARDPYLRVGLKLHFGNSDVQLGNPEHVAALREVLRAANVHRMAVVVATRIRQLGRERVLYGSDGTPELLPPDEALEAFRQLPLSDAEFRTILSNVAPYMRRSVPGVDGGGDGGGSLPDRRR